MAITDAYASEAEYYARFTNRTERADSARVKRALEAATRWIASRTHQFFTSGVEARVFVGAGGPCLKVCGSDNCPGIASQDAVEVRVDLGANGAYSTLLTSGQFELHPLNAQLGDEHSPFKEIVLPPWTSAPISAWPRGVRVRVQATFGWPEIPAGIVSGCIELAGILLGDSPLAKRTYTDMGAVGASLEAREIVREQIDIYREAVLA